MTVCYRGISSSISNDQLFESSGAGLFLQALETITSMQGLSSQTEDGILTLSLPGSEEDPAFSAKLNLTDAELLEVSFPQEKFQGGHVRLFSQQCKLINAPLLKQWSVFF